jgi:hypothetical protein
MSNKQTEGQAMTEAAQAPYKGPFREHLDSGSVVDATGCLLCDAGNSDRARWLCDTLNATRPAPASVGGEDSNDIEIIRTVILPIVRDGGLGVLGKSMKIWLALKAHFTPPITQPGGEREAQRLFEQRFGHLDLTLFGSADWPVVYTNSRTQDAWRGFNDGLQAARATAPAGHVLTEQEIVDLIEANTGVSTENGRLCVVNANIAARAIISRLTSTEPKP